MSKKGKPPAGKWALSIYAKNIILNKQSTIYQQNKMYDTVFNMFPLSWYFLFEEFHFHAWVKSFIHFIQGFPFPCNLSKFFVLCQSVLKAYHVVVHLYKSKSNRLYYLQKTVEAASERSNANTRTTTEQWCYLMKSWCIIN